MLANLIPGDPAYAILGENASEEQIALVHEQLGVNDSLPERYVSWLSNAARGDLGKSVITGRPVASVIAERLPITVQLAVMATAIALLLAVPIALISVRWTDTLVDRMSLAGSSALASSPVFLTGILLMYIFALKLGWFPATGWVRMSESLSANLRHSLLPALALGLYEAPVFIRVLRGDLLATTRQDFVRSVRARGFSDLYVLARHALRASCFSLVTLAGIAFGRLMGGTIIVETVFALPGLGQLMVDAVRRLDIVMVQGVAVVVAFVWVVVTMIVDVSYTYIDPRVTAEATR
jgi:peptide/nickel transport system permease protein